MNIGSKVNSFNSFELKISLFLEVEGWVWGGGLLKGTCNPGQSLILWRSKKKKKNQTNYDRISTFQNVWGKPDFTSEQFLNQADLERVELNSESRGQCCCLRNKKIV